VKLVALQERDVVSVGHHLFHLVGRQLREYVDEGLVSFEAAELTVRTPAGRTLLDDVSFCLDERSFLAVVGPSGAGKSTLLNALTGFRPAGAGTVSYDGRDLYANYEELRLRIGFVPQQDVLHQTLTVRQALGYAAELRFPEDVAASERSERVEKVLGELGLTEAGDRPINVLSGGQRRRVAVAVELLDEPSLLFLDEPTSGLDPGYERSLMDQMRSIADGGHTVEGLGGQVDVELLLEDLQDLEHAEAVAVEVFDEARLRRDHLTVDVHHLDRSVGQELEDLVAVHLVLLQGCFGRQDQWPMPNPPSTGMTEPVT